LPSIRVLQNIAQAANDVGIPISVCGEAAGKPVEAMLLASLGYRRLSMHGAKIGPIKSLIRGMHFAETKAKIDALLESPNSEFRKDLLNIMSEITSQI
jgi:phosphotransferase system enzyme I (PtsP)